MYIDFKILTLIVEFLAKQVVRIETGVKSCSAVAALTRHSNDYAYIVGYFYMVAVLGMTGKELLATATTTAASFFFFFFVAVTVAMTTTTTSSLSSSSFYQSDISKHFFELFDEISCCFT